MRRFGILIGLCLVVLGFFVPLKTLGQNRYRVNVMVISNSEAKVRVLHVATFLQGHTNYECVGFTNTGDRIVNAVRFRFTYVEANKHIAGFDTIEPHGPFQPGASEDIPNIVVGQMYDRGALEHFHNCQSFNYPTNEIALLITTVDRVEFADGSVWEGPRPFASPSTSPSAAPSASPSPTPESLP